MDEKIKVIFLDIDGVLNGYGLFTEIFYKIFFFLRKEEWFTKYFNIFGVHTRKVRLLKEIIRKTKAKVVLCSSLRYKLFKVPYEEQSEFCKKITLTFFKNHIDIYDITPNLGTEFKREDEINLWLLTNGINVTNYVILDDEPSEYPHLREKYLVQTSNILADEFITGAWTDNSGLKKKHVKYAIELLNDDNRKI